MTTDDESIIRHAEELIRYYSGGREDERDAVLQFLRAHGQEALAVLIESRMHVMSYVATKAGPDMQGLCEQARAQGRGEARWAIARWLRWKLRDARRTSGKMTKADQEWMRMIEQDAKDIASGDYVEQMLRERL